MITFEQDVSPVDFRVSDRCIKVLDRRRGQFYEQGMCQIRGRKFLRARLGQITTICRSRCPVRGWCSEIERDARRVLFAFSRAFRQ